MKLRFRFFPDAKLNMKFLYSSKLYVRSSQFLLMLTVVIAFSFRLLKTKGSCMRTTEEVSAIVYGWIHELMRKSIVLEIIEEEDALRQEKLLLVLLGEP